MNWEGFLFTVFVVASLNSYAALILLVCGKITDTQLSLAHAVCCLVAACSAYAAGKTGIAAFCAIVSALLFHYWWRQRDDDDRRRRRRRRRAELKVKLRKFATIHIRPIPLGGA